MDDVLTLIGQTFAKNEYGVDIPTPYSRQILGRVEDVTRAEFFNAGRNGLNPSFKFTCFPADYQGETVCEFHGKPYSIYRTHQVPGTDELEIYVERKGGTNGAQS